jgi:hypothetical protein
MGTYNRRYDLSLVRILRNSDEYAGEEVVQQSFIIENSYRASDYYYGSSKIFRIYEELMEDNRESVKKYQERHPNRKFVIEPPTIEFINLIGFDESELPTVRRLFDINEKSDYLKTVYQRVQSYGGSEEGGWYYHNLYLTDMNPSDLTEDDLELSRYGEGFVIEKEFYLGQKEKTGREYYQ